MEELIDYIKKNLKKGYPKDSLKWALTDQGYSKFEIDRAFKKAEIQLSIEAPILKTKPIIKHEIIEPKDFSVSSENKSFWRKLFG